MLKNSRGGVHRFLSTLAVLILIVTILAGALTAYWYLGPYKGFGEETFLEVDRGMSSRAIARQLAAQGIVRSRWAFLLVRALHPTATLQAGEYRFASEETPWQVFQKIRRGEIFFEEFTVPEGSNIFDIAALLRNSDTVNADAFLEAAADSSTIRDLDPVAPNLEGYLFPSTYRVTHKTTGRQLCHIMTSEFRKQWAELRGGSTGQDVHRIVTIASLVEKETAIAQERPLVAAVYMNRLRADIPLQCDPTTIYAAELEKRYKGAIHRSDLASTNPYNTYAHPGLPPGAIANPGLASLKAALHPAASDFLYFVAKPDGSGAHQFSATLEQHEKAVLAYRKARP